MWLPQGGALKIENLQFTQYSIIMLLSSMLDYQSLQLHTHTEAHTDRAVTSSD